MVVSHLA